MQSRLALDKFSLDISVPEVGDLFWLRAIFLWCDGCAHDVNANSEFSN